MKVYSSGFLLILTGLLAGQTSCSSPPDRAHPSAEERNGEIKRVQNDALTVRIDGSGKARDENGVELTPGEISARLARGTVKQSTPIVILVYGTQKDGVLDASDMFASLGFKSVVIRLVLTDPLK